MAAKGNGDDDPFAGQKLTPEEQNLYWHHYYNLKGGGAVEQPGGEVSTIYQTPVEGPGGRYYNIPTVWGGQILTVPEAKERAAAVPGGMESWPSYATPEAADLAYEARVHPLAATDEPTYRALHEALVPTPDNASLIQALRSGDPEAAAAAEASKAMEPIVGPYLADVVTGRAAMKSLEEHFGPNANPLDIALMFSGGGLKVKGEPVAAPSIGKGSEAPLFDLSRLAERPEDVPQVDLPRYDPPRGVPEKYTSAMADPANKARFRQMFEAGREGGMGWYGTQPLRDTFREVLGAERGQQAYERYLDYVGITSPRTPVPENVRNASYWYGLDMRGEPLKETVADPGKAPKIVPSPDAPKGLPSPYGGLSQRNVMRMARMLRGMDPVGPGIQVREPSSILGPGFTILQNPKPPSFTANLRGNWRPITADVHNVRGWGMEGDIPDIGYGHIEDVQQAMAKKLKVDPAQLQAGGWVGGEAGTELSTGQRSGGAPFLQHLEDRVRLTAQRFGQDPRETLRRFIRGEQPLLSIPVAAAAGGAAMAGGGGEAKAARGNAGLDIDPSTGREDPTKEPVPQVSEEERQAFFADPRSRKPSAALSLKTETSTGSPKRDLPAAPESFRREVIGHESGGRPNIGWQNTDLTPYLEAGKTIYGAPDWPGKPSGTFDANGKELMSTAMGLYGITKTNWKKYAPLVGVNDFSPESQTKVFNRMYAESGEAPWRPFWHGGGGGTAAGVLGRQRIGSKAFGIQDDDGLEDEGDRRERDRLRAQFAKFAAEHAPTEELTLQAAPAPAAAAAPAEAAQPKIGGISPPRPALPDIYVPKATNLRQALQAALASIMQARGGNNPLDEILRQ